SRGSLWPRPARVRASLGGTSVAPDPRPIPPDRVITGATAGRDFPAHAGVVTCACCSRAGPLHRRGPALGGCVHFGVPVTVHPRVPPRPYSCPVPLPPRVQTLVGSRRSPDPIGAESPDQTTGW